MLGTCTHVNKYLDLKYKYKYLRLKYEYKYKYSGLKYKYKYFKHVLEYNSITSTSTKYTSLLESDHRPLEYLQTSYTQNPRLMRWSLALQPYRFTVRYIRGTENVTADYLSRSSE